MRLATGVTLRLRPAGRSSRPTPSSPRRSTTRRGRGSTALADVRTVWDLYCGVGGFALHLAGARPRGARRRGVGRRGRRGAGHGRRAGRDAASSPRTRRRTPSRAGDVPDLVVVNPPRRGIGAGAGGLAGGVRACGHVVYSSCNAESLARDLPLMPSLRPVRGAGARHVPAHHALRGARAADPVRVSRAGPSAPCRCCSRGCCRGGRRQRTG